MITIELDKKGTLTADLDDNTWYIEFIPLSDKFKKINFSLQYNNKPDFDMIQDKVTKSIEMFLEDDLLIDTSSGNLLLG